jgi:uncharacterized tellurite resistance protein B-like protein
MGTIAERFQSGEQSAHKGTFNNLVMLARVDGKVDETEQALLNRIAHRLSLTDEQVNDILSNPDNYPMIPPASKEERFERFVQFIEMVCIDGVVDPSEEKLATKYGVALGFDSDDIDAIEATIIEHVKTGTSADAIVELLM